MISWKKSVKIMAAIVIAILFFNECVQYKDIPAENKLKNVYL
jgi:PBP1b-binding outer membrane lipoprotein LpoB